MDEKYRTLLVDKGVWSDDLEVLSIAEGGVIDMFVAGITSQEQGERIVAAIGTSASWIDLHRVPHGEYQIMFTPTEWLRSN